MPGKEFELRTSNKLTFHWRSITNPQCPGRERKANPRWLTRSRSPKPELYHMYIGYIFLALLRSRESHTTYFTHCVTAEFHNSTFRRKFPHSRDVNAQCDVNLCLQFNSFSRLYFLLLNALRPLTKSFLNRGLRVSVNRRSVFIGSVSTTLANLPKLELDRPS